MIELTDEDRALLELAGDGHAPTEQDRARVRAALASRLGTAAGLGLAAAGLSAKTATTAAAVAGAKTATATVATAATGGATGVAATAGTVGIAVAAKVIGAAVLVSLTVGVGATVIHRDRRPPPSPAISIAPRPAPVHRPAVVPAAAAPSPAEAREVQAPGTRPPPALAARAMHRTDESPAPAVTGPSQVQPAPFKPPAPMPSRAVADEAALLHASLDARRSGHPAQALELLDRHAILYPRGVLTEERDAERALVLADLGRAPEARAAIGEFLRAHPASPLAARLRERQRLLDLARP